MCVVLSHSLLLKLNQLWRLPLRRNPKLWRRSIVCTVMISKCWFSTSADSAASVRQCDLIRFSAGELRTVFRACDSVHRTLLAKKNKTNVMERNCLSFAPPKKYIDSSVVARELLGYSGWLLGCLRWLLGSCWVLWVIATWLLGWLKWLLGSC